jgi:hypothetical protein
MILSQLTEGLGTIRLSGANQSNSSILHASTLKRIHGDDKKNPPLLKLNPESEHM